MNSDYSARIGAQYDLRLYHEAKGYRYEGYNSYWEPQDPCDLEPIEPSYGPGAMNRGELEDWDNSDVEEF